MLKHVVQAEFDGKMRHLRQLHLKVLDRSEMVVLLIPDSLISACCGAGEG